MSFFLSEVKHYFEKKVITVHSPLRTALSKQKRHVTLSSLLKRDCQANGTSTFDGKEERSGGSKNLMLNVCGKSAEGALYGSCNDLK